MSRRVVFVTQEDPFYVRLFFEEMFRAWNGAADITAVVIAPAMGHRSLVSLARQMYGLYGPIGFVRLGFRFAWYKLARRLVGLLGLKRSYSVAQECTLHGIPVHEAPDLNSADFLEWLRGRQVDLLVSVAAPQIFRRPLLEVPRLGCVNIHNSLLPRYRGMLPNFWQLYHGEKVVGASVHRVNEALDDGEILLQHRVDVLPDESLESLIVRTKRKGAYLMIDAVKGIFEGTLQALPNDSRLATRFTFPTRADAREFRRRGGKLF
jgi:methionyl-tRNA formyltransferase